MDKLWGQKRRILGRTRHARRRTWPCIAIELDPPHLPPVSKAISKKPNDRLTSVWQGLLFASLGSRLSSISPASIIFPFSQLCRSAALLLAAPPSLLLSDPSTCGPVTSQHMLRTRTRRGRRAHTKKKTKNILGCENMTAIKDDGAERARGG